MKFILGSIPNGAGTMVLWFLWSLIYLNFRDYSIGLGLLISTSTECCNTATVLPFSYTGLVLSRTHAYLTNCL